MGRTAWVGMVVGLTGLAAAAPAAASSVKADYSGVTFTADTGEANVVTFAGSGGAAGLVTVTDDGAVLHAGTRCSSVDEHHATCQLYPSSSDPLIANLGDGNDQVSATADLSLRAYGGAGTDLLTGGPGDDILAGGPGNDQIDGGAGNDALEASSSFYFPFDTTGAGLGADVVRGGPDTDGIGYGSRTGPVSVTLGSGGANDGEAGESDDLGGDIEDVGGTNYADVIVGGANANHIYGGDGNDRLYGANGADVIDPGPGADYVSGGNGNDAFAFGFGYGGDSASDQFFGGAGVDSVSYAFIRAEVHVSLNNGADDGAIGDNDNVHSDVENVKGGTHRNILVGSDVANVLEGAHDGNFEWPPYSADTISGLGGDDTLYGRGGADVLNGGAGNDTLDAAEFDQPYYGFGDPTMDDVDYMYGGPGNDTLVAHDFVTDRVDCGSPACSTARRSTRSRSTRRVVETQ